MDGTTAPASMGALTRITSAHPRMRAAVSTAPTINGLSTG